MAGSRSKLAKTKNGWDFVLALAAEKASLPLPRYNGCTSLPPQTCLSLSPLPPPFSSLFYGQTYASGTQAAKSFLL